MKRWFKFLVLAALVEVTLTPTSPNNPTPGHTFKVTANVNRCVSLYASDEGGSYILYRDAPAPSAGNPNPPEVTKVFETEETPAQIRQLANGPGN